MCETPIYDFVKKYADGENMRMHMPGHKGKSFLGVEKFDVTEIDGADVLYHSDGIIRRSEQIASSLFGTARTVYSCEGSSLSIRAMLYLAVLYAKKLGREPIIYAGRNAHKVFATAAALLDFGIKWIYPKNGGIVSCEISASELDRALTIAEKKPIAVYVTSPDYLGNISDISALSAVCKKHGVLLLVDNAHGAYLGFLEKSLHPIHLGADICCDSAHKTLPVLTGGGYLHFSKDAPHELINSAENAMALFASTSPSYVIMQSLDLANAYISDGYRRRLAEYSSKVEALKTALSAKGFTLCGDEPLKLTVMPKDYGYTGSELAEFLAENGIICEFSDPDYLVLMLTPENGDEALSRLFGVLCGLSRREKITVLPPKLSPCRAVLSPREAMLSPSERLNTTMCVGRILANANVSCPPAIPIAASGERLDESSMRLFEYYGIDYCEVVCE